MQNIQSLMVPLTDLRPFNEPRNLAFRYKTIRLIKVNTANNLNLRTVFVVVEILSN